MGRPPRHHSVWQHITDRLQVHYADPRVAIAMHIGWERYYTQFSQMKSPEPNNYNRAVHADRARDTGFIKDQVFYYDQPRSGWMSVYYVPNSQRKEYEDWLEQEIKHNNIYSHWTNNKPASIRPYVSLLDRRRLNQSELILEERLYQQGYYANLISKYSGDNDMQSYIRKIVGEPRGLVSQTITET